MIKRLTIFIIILCVGISISAQDRTIIKGILVDAVSGKPIQGAHIKVNQKHVVTSTNAKGDYSLTIQKAKRTALVFSFVGYKTVYEPISNKDTIVLDVKLEKKTEVLPDYEFVEDGKPKIVFKSPKINIADYEFYDDRFLFLVYGKRLNKDSQIYLVDEDEKIISKHFVPGTPVELYTDYLGNINLICEKAIYRVGAQNDKVYI